MNKIISGIILSSLFFSVVPMQGAAQQSFTRKLGFVALASLYVIGSAAITYACYQDSEKKIKELKEQAAFIEEGLKQFPRSDKQKDKRHQEYENELSAAYAKPGQVGMLFGLIGISAVLHCMYFR